VGRGHIHIDAPPADNLRAVAEAKHCAVGDLTVMILDIGKGVATVLAAYAEKEPRLRPMVNTYGRGPANAWTRSDWSAC